MIDSVQHHDYPVIQSVLLLSAGVYVLINLLIDLSYKLFDPRIRVLSMSSACPSTPAPRRGCRPAVRAAALALGAQAPDADPRRAVLLVAIALLSIAAPWIATHDPQDIDPLARLQPPSAEHFFGTDAMGRDVFSRAVWGGRVSIITGISVAVLATVFGILIGLVAGFVRGSTASSCASWTG